MSTWQGATSSKFGKTKKLITFVPASETSTQGLYSDVDTGIQIIKGRKHFSLPSEQRYQTWRSSIKVPAPIQISKRPTGVRRISPIYTETQGRPERSHVPPTRKEVVGLTFNDHCEVKYQGAYTLNNRIW